MTHGQRTVVVVIIHRGGGTAPNALPYDDFFGLFYHYFLFFYFSLFVNLRDRQISLETVITAITRSPQSAIGGRGMIEESAKKLHLVTAVPFNSSPSHRYRAYRVASKRRSRVHYEFEIVLYAIQYLFF